MPDIRWSRTCRASSPAYDLLAGSGLRGRCGTREEPERAGSIARARRDEVRIRSGDVAGEVTGGDPIPREAPRLLHDPVRDAGRGLLLTRQVLVPEPDRRRVREGQQRSEDDRGGDDGLDQGEPTLVGGEGAETPADHRSGHRVPPAAGPGAGRADARAHGWARGSVVGALRSICLPSLVISYASACTRGPLERSWARRPAGMGVRRRRPATIRRCIRASYRCLRTQPLGRGPSARSTARCRRTLRPMSAP